VLAHNSDDRGLMARDSIELNLDDATPSQGTPSRARGSIQQNRNQRSAFNDQPEQENRTRARVLVPQESRRRRGVRNEDDSELLINPEDLDLEELDNEEPQFLRTERRVPVRRSALAKKTASRLKIAGIAAAAAMVVGGLSGWAYSYGTHSWRFRIPSSDAVDITGVHNASLAHVRDVAASEAIARNIFSIDLDERRRHLEQIPWVEQATVMRLLPNRIAVSIQERTPVAFAQIGPRVSLIDAKGVVLGMPADRKTKYSFPVIRGITETEPLSSRAAAMKIYNRVVEELGSSDEGAKYVQQLSEVDLSDPEDVKVTANDAGGTMVVHLGASDFLQRYKLYVGHIAEWRQQFPNLQSVDLRYEGQVVVNPDNRDIGSSGHRVIGDAPPAKAPAAKPVSHKAAKPNKHAPQRTQRAQR
jgi:cell division protein FtsQ